MTDIVFAKVFTALLAIGVMLLFISAIYGTEVGAFLGMTVMVVLFCSAIGFMAKVFIDEFNEIEKEREDG